MCDRAAGNCTDRGGGGTGLPGARSPGAPRHRAAGPAERETVALRCSVAWIRSAPSGSSVAGPQRGDGGACSVSVCDAGATATPRPEGAYLATRPTARGHRSNSPRECADGEHGVPGSTARRAPPAPSALRRGPRGVAQCV
jgi:hypothetical protein